MFAVCNSYKIKTSVYVSGDQLDFSKGYKAQAYPAMVA